jgi:energy-coupling factor transporter transmembrane protein EcfT
MRLFRYPVVLLAVLTIPAFGQTTTTINLATQSRNADFSKFPFTRPLTQGSSLPATCQVGQLFFNTAAAAGETYSPALRRTVGQL